MMSCMMESARSYFAVGGLQYERTVAMVDQPVESTERRWHSSMQSNHSKRARIYPVWYVAGAGGQSD